MAIPGPVLLKCHVSSSKTNPLVEEVELLQTNPLYAHVHYPDGWETTVSVKHLVPKPEATFPCLQLQVEVNLYCTCRNFNLHSDHGRLAEGARDACELVSLFECGNSSATVQQTHQYLQTVCCITSTVPEVEISCWWHLELSLRFYQSMLAQVH